MPAKYIELKDIGKVAFYKRHGVHGVKLSINHDGSVRVTLPTWAPYRLGIEFVKNKAEWIKLRRPSRSVINNGDRVGKAHRIIFNQHLINGIPGARLTGTDIRVSFSNDISSEGIEIQEIIEKASIRALKKEARQLLPQRVETLAAQYGFNYNSVAIKQLKSRWGSCNERRDIVLNCFLMQLPWHLIDYVILHELVHTKVLRHGNPFWSELQKYVINLSQIRKEMKSHQPTLKTIPATSVDGIKQKAIHVVTSI